FDDGDYDFYFRSGAHVHGDCDGYNSEPGGKTTIYEWSQSEINKWEKRLFAAGVKPEVYRTSKPKHCWVRFDTDLLNGIGYTGRDRWTNNPDNDIAFVAAKAYDTNELLDMLQEADIATVIPPVKSRKEQRAYSHEL
ncbi:hypothetical protein, partial [Treponema endosymbiont of Eucomonympha sp.]|uniref:hypothetical protein n=1 Tax=Treponema endosymbiont of Eucomonympha sp. TaxID=1580831 RepID=UPI000A63F424